MNPVSFLVESAAGVAEDAPKENPFAAGEASFPLSAEAAAPNVNPEDGLLLSPPPAVAPNLNPPPSVLQKNHHLTSSEISTKMLYS